MKQILKYSILSFAFLLIQSCKSIDLRTEAMITEDVTSLEEKGKKILHHAYLKMGYDHLINTEVYETTAFFDWKGLWLLFPMNAIPGNNKKDIQFRFATNSFDGHVEYLQGRKKGIIQGLQSWQGYKSEIGSDIIKEHEHDRYIWGLATYHYLLESPITLKDADIVRYAGEKKFNNQDYDLVYVTWGSESPNKQYDRFLVYINKDSGFIDLMELTIGDFFLPMPKGMQHATVQFERSKTSIGVFLPEVTIIQLKHPKEKKRHVYKFTTKDYKFDSFEKSKLYPIKGLKLYGNSKKYNNDEI